MADITLNLILIATALNGIVAGASLDQAIKQLPTRHRIGVVPYSTYSQNADLGNGIPWYVGLGISTVLVTIGATLAALSQQLSSEKLLPLYLAVVFSVLHSLVTSQAAPLMFKQRQHQNDEAALTILFNQFARLHLFRTLFQVITFASLLWALVSYLR
jgi:hypothetical protein